MGCGASNQNPGAAITKRIDLQLKEDKRRLEDEIKILLLGAGESGKSTIAKQFKIINVGEYTEDELMDWKVVVLDNTFFSIKTLVLASEKLGVPIQPENQALAERIKELTPLHITLTPEIAKDIKTLWNDPGIQETFSRSSEYQLNDNTKYCLENIDRVSAPNYVPTQTDVIHCRVRTTGVIETNFELGKRKVRLVDVGGQRAERRKWMSCFEEVTAVIFCVALSEYDQKLAEDETTNRLQESLGIFEELVTKWFLKTTIILFLNKSDIFREKIKKTDLSVCFRDYDGGLNYEKGVAYIQNKFLSLDKFIDDTGNGRTRVFPHVTCATDTNNVRMVFEAIKETLINANLAAAGLI